MNFRIKPKYVYVNECNTGLTAISWPEVAAKIGEFAEQLYGHMYADGRNAMARRVESFDHLLRSFGVAEPKLWAVTPNNSVETPKSFTVELGSQVARKKPELRAAVTVPPDEQAKAAKVGGEPVPF